MSKPWSGRFSEDTDAFVEEFTQSVSFDRELAYEDIEQDIAHVKTLFKAGVISEEEKEKLIKGLLDLKKDIEEGKVEWKSRLEDVHMNLEALLTERLGDVGGKLHTGRSRNDQITTDERLYLKKQLRDILSLLKQLRITLLDLAQKHIDVLLPSYTHLQRAQPIRLAHYFLAFREMFLKDSERFADAYRRIDELTLGSGAVAGVDFPLDRFFTASELGFNRVSRNSMYATADRDFIAEFLFCCACTGMHLSRLSEDLILWASEEFSYIELPDKLCTGSSIMPQKKNPDVLELIRGKTGRLYGNLIALMTTVKALPMSYNRDLQEDKEPLFDSVRTLKGSLNGMIKVLKGLRPKSEVMERNAGNFVLITDVANFLVDKGVPFRRAHEIAGRIVAYLIDRSKRLEDMSLEEFKMFSEDFDESVLELLNPQVVADRRKTFGGTSKERLLEAIEAAKLEEGV